MVIFPVSEKKNKNFVLESDVSHRSFFNAFLSP